MIESSFRRVEAWLFAPGDARRLAAVRIGLSSLLAARLIRGVYRGLAGQPRPLYRPLSFMHLLPGMPSRGVVVALQTIGVTAAIVAAIGWRPRLSLSAAWGCALLLNGMATSVGKIVHNDVLLMLALVPLLAAPSADAWSIEATRRRAAGSGLPRLRSPRYGWPVRTALVVVAGAYFFTGLAKVVFSGPAWVISDNMRWVMYAASDAQRVPNALGLFIADRPWLAHVVAAATLLFELSFPLVLWRPRMAWLFVPGAVLMHTAIRVTLHLDYSAWAVTVVVLFVDWAWLADWARTVRGQRAHREMPAAAKDRPAAPLPA